MENRKEVCMISDQECHEASFDDNSWHDPVNIKNRTSPVSIDELFAPVKEEYFNSDILFLKQVIRTAPSTLPDSVLEQLFGKLEPTVLPDSVSDDTCSNRSGNYDGDGDTLEADEAIVLPDSLLDDICFVDFDDLVYIKNRTSPVSIDELFAPVKEEYFNSGILFLKQVTRTAPSTLPDSVLEQLFGKLEPTVLPDSVSDDMCSNSGNYDGDTLEGDEAIVLPDSLLDDICFDFDDLAKEK